MVRAVEGRPALRTVGVDLQLKDVILIVVSLLSLAVLNYLVKHGLIKE